MAGYGAMSLSMRRQRQGDSWAPRERRSGHCLLRGEEKERKNSKPGDDGFQKSSTFARWPFSTPIRSLEFHPEPATPPSLPSL